MSRRELDGLEVDVLSYLLENGEKRFIEIAEALYPKHIKNFTDENHFKVVLSRKLDSFLKQDYLKKKVLGHKNVRYYIPQEKWSEVAGEVKRYRTIEEIKKINPEEIEKLLKELEHYKRLSRIRELEDLPVLPLTPVLKRLVQLGFEPEDFYDMEDLSTRMKKYGEKIIKKGVFYIKIDEGDGYHFEGKISPHFLTNYFEEDILEKQTKPKDIEIKLIPQSEVKGKTIVHGKTVKVKKILTPSEVYRRFGPGWIILTKKPIKGHYIIGAYKELLQLYAEEFEYNWLEYKEEFNLSDEEWKRVGPHVAWLMLFEAGRVDLPIMIDNYLYEYVQSKNPNGLEELKKFYARYGEKKAEEYAKRAIEEFKEEFHDLAKRPVEEIWREYEEQVKKSNETNQRIFQYLKSKYCPDSA